MEENCPIINSDDLFIKRIHQVYIENLKNSSSFSKAENLRINYDLLKYINAKKRLPADEFFLSKLTSEYSNLVDSPNGLDNYSSCILTLGNLVKNECHLWKTSDSLAKKFLSQKQKGKPICSLPNEIITWSSYTGKESSLVQQENNRNILNKISSPNSSSDNNISNNLSVNSNMILTMINCNVPVNNDSKMSFTKANCNVPVNNDSNYRSNNYGNINYNEGSSQDKYCGSKTFPAQVHKRRQSGYYKLKRGKFEEDDMDSEEENNACFGYKDKNNIIRNAEFKTAKQKLITENQKNCSVYNDSSYGVKKSLGTRGPASKFVPPVINKDSNDFWNNAVMNKNTTLLSSSMDPRYQNLDSKMVELISSEIMDHGPPITWNDIAGLEFAKKTIKEIVVWPMLRPDIFTGLRGPPKGLLLFGPPGTGKTLIGKCIASQSKSTFFSISASSLTSKWVGEGEKMVKTLFMVARVNQPAVIFIDEIDSLLSQRSGQEHESSRRIKTEFLVQLDGATTEENDRILVVGATNRPQEIDEAARRRFVKRLYIPLPEKEARKRIINLLMCKQNHSLSEEEVESISVLTDGYSGADMANLCREAAIGPIRRLNFDDIDKITADEVQSIDLKDFQDAIKQVRASVSENDLEIYLDWNKQYGSWDA